MIGRWFWNIEPLWSLEPPRPRHEIVCPICNNNIFYFKHARLFKRHPESVGTPRSLRDQYRTDIAIKCDKCGLVMFFGVHLTKTEFEDLRAIFIANGIDNLMLEYKHVGHWVISPEYRKIEEIR